MEWSIHDDAQLTSHVYLGTLSVARICFDHGSHCFCNTLIRCVLEHEKLTCASCFDEGMHLSANMRPHVLACQVDENGFITDSRFKTFGCGSAIASSSVVTEWIRGKSLDEVVRIKNSEIAKHLSLPPVKLHCSMLAEDAIKVRG